MLAKLSMERVNSPSVLLLLVYGKVNFMRAQHGFP